MSNIESGSYPNLFGKIKIKHLIYLSIFIVGAVIRFVAVYKNPITDHEAEILFGILESLPEIYISPLLGIIIRISFFLFGQSVIPIRFGSALAGSFILLTPMLYEKHWGERKCVSLSLFFAIDPFLITNAIQLNGNSYALLFTLVAIAMFFQNNYLYLISSVILLLLSGKFLMPIFLIGIAPIILKFFIKNEIRNKIKDYLIEKGDLFRSQIDYQRNYILVFILIAFIILALAKVTISSSLHPLENSTLSINRFVFDRTGLFFIALISYLPMGLIVFISSLSKGSEMELGSKKIVFSLILITFLFISLFPNSSLIDLAWVSVPISFLLSSQLQPFLQFMINSWKKVSIWIIGVLTVFIYLFLIAMKYFSPYLTDTNIFQAIVSITLAFMIILITSFLISFLYNYSMAKDILLTCSILTLLIFQTSIAWKAAGFGTNPEMEILWPNGFFKDHDTIDTTIREMIGNKFGTTAKITMLIKSSSSPVFLWEVDQFTDQNNKDISYSSRPSFIITHYEKTIDGNFEDFIGQEFVVNEKPSWVNDPISSFFTKDYWSWLFYRISPSSQEKNILWVSKEFFPDFIGAVENK